MKELTFEQKIEAAKRHLEKAAEMCQKWHDSLPPGALTLPAPTNGEEKRESPHPDLPTRIESD